ncbi:hypothetical protein [Salisaeta longa]|uniref:hypothetical protein n=1 Tax=Salisaeta longa TaxID=503170 RepID=UPI0003B55622|nr:hypothetical protein [Salisaeta longa]
MTLTAFYSRLRGALRLGVVLVAVFSAAGCVSTQDRYEEAQALTAEGRYVEATRYYVRVLTEEPSWTDARAELRAVGQRAVDRLLQTTERHAAAERYQAAVASLRTVDDLRAAARGVDVSLTVPSNYQRYRAEMRRAAADALIARAQRAEDAGDWPDAHAAYTEARSYIATEARRTALNQAQARVLVHWGQQNIQKGRFQTAYKRLGQVTQFVKSGHPLAETSRKLQADAVARGTRRVAFLPVTQDGRAATRLPDIFLPDLNHVLAFDYWTAAPLFVAPVNPVRLRRALRRYGFFARPLSDEQAVTVGRRVDADWVVAATLTDIEQTEEVTEQTSHRVPWRPPSKGRHATSDRAPSTARDTSYVVQTVEKELAATAHYRIIDVDNGWVLERGTTWLRHEAPVQRARFAGNWRQLVLPPAQRPLFNGTAQRGWTNQAIDRFAAALSASVFEDVLDEIE